MNDNTVDDILYRFIEEGRPISALGSDKVLAKAVAVKERIEGLFALLKQSPIHDSHSSKALAPGVLIGDFEIIRQIGHGGFGQVYLALQLSLNRMVAVKVCDGQDASQQSIRTRFMSESRILAKIRHPNIVPVITAGDDAGRLYLVMEYLPGPTFAHLLEVLSNSSNQSASSVLLKLVQGDEPVSMLWGNHATIDRAYWIEVTRLLRMVARGLAELHSQNIVHRDVKPSNVVVDKDGVARLVDFGLARADDDVRVTLSHVFIGTPAYTSPEQAAGHSSKTSTASDVFSLGIMFYEFLSFKRPFDAESPARTIQAVIECRHRTLRSVRKEVPWELEAIVEKCLNKDQGQRYNNAAELLQDIDAYLDLRPITARRITWAYRAITACRRRPWVLATTVLATCALALAIIMGINAHAAGVARKNELAVEKYRSFINSGDCSLFSALHSPRPQWLPEELERDRSNAMQSFEHASELDAGAFWPRMQCVRLLLASKRNADLIRARDELYKLNALKPKYVSILHYLSVVSQRLEDTANATKYQGLADSMYPIEGEDLYFIANALGSLNRMHKEAYPLYTACLAITPNHYWAKLERNMFGVAATSDADAIHHFRIEELTTIDKQYRDMPFAREFLVELAKSDSIYDDQELEQAESLIRDFGLTIIRGHQLADVYISRKRFSDAYSILEKVLPQDARGLTATRLGDCAERESHLDLAERWYQQAIDDKCHDDKPWLRLAKILMLKGQESAAEAVLLSAIKTFPDRASIRVHYADWLSERERSDKAEVVFREVLALPKNHNRLGEQMEQTSDIDTALLSLIKLLVARGDREEAVSLLEKVMEVNPNANSRIWIALLNSYLQAGNHVKARALLNRACRDFLAQPTSIEKLNTASDMLRATGRKNQMLARMAGYAASFLNDSSARRRFEDIAFEMDPNEGYASLKSWIKFESGATIEDYEYVNLVIGQMATPASAPASVPWDNVNPEEIIKKGLKAYPRSAYLWATLAIIEFQQRDHQQAEAAFARAKAIHLDELGGLNRDKQLNDAGSSLELNSVLPTLFEYLLRNNRQQECDTLQESLQALYKRLDYDGKFLTRYRAVAEYRSGRWKLALVMLERAKEQRVVLADEAIPMAFECYSNLQDVLGMTATMHAYSQTPRANSQLLVNMLWRVELEADEYCSKKTFEMVRAIPPPLLASDPMLRATIEAFVAWFAVSSGKEISVDVKRKMFEQADKSIRNALDIDPDFVAGPLWIAQMVVAWEHLDDSRSSYWKELLTAMPPSEVTKVLLLMRKIDARDR